MFDRIVVPVDGSAASERALQYALVLAAPDEAAIEALFVLDSSDVPGGFDDAAPQSRVESALRASAGAAFETVDRVCAGTEVPVSTTVAVGHPADSVLDAVTGAPGELVVMGVHDRGRLARFLRHSVAETVARHSPVPVLTVRATAGQGDPAIRRILLATDGSESAREARTYALALAAAHDATVQGLYVIDARFGPSGPLRSLLNREAERVARDVRAAGARAGVDVVPATVTGTPVAEIVAVASDRHADLIVIGTHGRAGIDRFVMGSVATGVLRTAPQPVLTVRSSPTE
jgi:nucleotide-binding universal stress UspA family protein